MTIIKWKHTLKKKKKEETNSTQNTSNHNKGKQKHTGLMTIRAINDPTLEPEEKNGTE